MLKYGLFTFDLYFDGYEELHSEELNDFMILKE